MWRRRRSHAHDEGADIPDRAAVARWRVVDEELHNLAAAPERQLQDIERLLEGLRAVRAAPPAPVGGEAQKLRIAQVRTITRRLVRQNRYQEALDILQVVIPTWQPDPKSGLPALAAHARTSLTGRASCDLVVAAAQALGGADEAWGDGDVALTAEMIVVGTGLLLHRDLHADVEHSPLADDPGTFLAPVRGSAAMKAVRRSPQRQGAVPRPSAPPDVAGRRDDEPRRRVVVLPGTYPRFAGPLVDALRGRPDLQVDVVDLPAASRSLRWLGTDPELIRLRLLHTRGQQSSSDARHGKADGTDDFGVPLVVRDLVQRADVVVADWGDRGAMWSSLVVPDGTRLVVRLHGMDSLSLWIHALDWSRVDALVTVSPHHAALTEEILRQSAAPAAERLPRCHVVPNVVRLPASSAVTPEVTREPHTLGMIGWGKRVKDPLWAVEVLAALRRRGRADWRLRLVGAGFEPGGVVTSREYARRFQERVAQADVAGAIDFVPQTDDVAGEVSRLGFVVSASRRESFHLGLVEGVLGGAVPVVREWPFYVNYGGPSRLFPPDWVVPDIDAAVERVWALRSERRRRRAAHDARSEVAARFDPQRTERLLLEAVLGAH